VRLHQESRLSLTSASPYRVWGKAIANKGKVPAIAYLRTSSAANVGVDKDSDRRQREAITAFAKRGGYELVAEFYDAAVSGADAIDSRPGFTATLERIEGNGVRTIIVETASRFARDLMVQEVGHAKLRERGIDLIAADNPGSFIDDTPTAKLVRQVLGAISEFDKAMTVAKLRGARERKRRDTSKCEGRKSHLELNPALVALVRQLRRRRPKGGQRSLREISTELAARGLMNERGNAFSAASIASMLASSEGRERYLPISQQGSGALSPRKVASRKRRMVALRLKRPPPKRGRRFVA
jgi:DNA invertase Pin-like site-specific DNA recombinase